MRWRLRDKSARLLRDRTRCTTVRPAAREFLVLLRILRNIGRIVHALEQVKKREYKNPDQIDKMPEQAAHLDAISQMLRIALVKFFAHRKPHVNEHDHAAQHVQSMETCDGKITGEIRAVRRQKHGRALDVCLLDRRNFIRDREREKMRPIHERIVWLSIHGIERDFVFFRILAVQVTSNLDSRFKSLFNASLVPQILLVLRERIRFNIRAEMLRSEEHTSELQSHSD